DFRGQLPALRDQRTAVCEVRCRSQRRDSSARKGDIERHDWHVRFVARGDLCTAARFARSLDDLQCPCKEDERISVDDQRPHPISRENLREVRTPGAKRVLGQLGLPLTPKYGGQDDRQNLAGEVGPYGPHGRATWVIPNERNAVTKC